MDNCHHRFEHVVEKNSFPYGETIEYDECVLCGAVCNTHVVTKKAEVMDDSYELHIQEYNI